MITVILQRHQLTINTNIPRLETALDKVVKAKAS